MNEWQESCVFTTFLPQNFLGIGRNEDGMKERIKLFFWFSRSVLQKKTGRVFDSQRRETLGLSENTNQVERHRKNLKIRTE